ncbi:MAG: hypothetical protein V3V17_07335 [Alphaproteobacteria bacterium]
MRKFRVKQMAAHRAVTIAVVFAALLTAGCAQTTAFKIGDDFTPRTDSPRVLLMAADIELSELSAAALPEPKADWTEAAKRHVTAALDAVMEERNAALVMYTGPAEGSPEERVQIQLIKLHAAVGNAILVHKYLPPMALPTKKDKFSWTLGAGAKALGDAYGADYALFVFMRDSYSSAGRVAVIVIGTLLGVPIQGGAQVGFASLVDLETGEIVWFNRLFSVTGDLRTPEPAREAIDQLLADFPL